MSGQESCNKKECSFFHPSLYKKSERKEFCDINICRFFHIISCRKTKSEEEIPNVKKLFFQSGNWKKRIKTHRKTQNTVKPAFIDLKIAPVLKNLVNYPKKMTPS